MSITYLGTASSAANSASASTIDITHTVTAGTGLLLLVCGARGTYVSSIEDWVTTDEPFVTISNEIPSGTNDQQPLVFGIVAPTAKTETITITFNAAAGYQWAAMINLAGNDEASVAAAVNLLEATTETFSTTTVFSSAGTAGNGLVSLAAGGGDDKSPASIDNSFVEVIDGNTGGGDPGNNDCSYHIAYLLNGAPSGPTITWSANDWQSGVFLEIVAAPAITSVSGDDIIAADETDWVIAGSDFGDD